MGVKFKTMKWVAAISFLFLMSLSVYGEVVYTEETMDTDPQAGAWILREGNQDNYTIADGIMSWQADTQWGVLDYYLVDEGDEAELFGVWVVDLVWRADETKGIGVYIGAVKEGLSDRSVINVMAQTNSASDSNQTVTIQKGNNALANDAIIPGFSDGFITGKFLIDPANERILYWLDDGTHSASGWVQMDWMGDTEIGRRVSIAAKSGCQGQIDYLKVSKRVSPAIVSDITDQGVVDLYDFSAMASRWGQDNLVEVPSAGPKGNLIGWWKFDEGSGDIVYDYSGNNWTANVLGFGPHTWDPEGGLYLDGFWDTDYVEIPNIYIADEHEAGGTINSMTISFWAKGDIDGAGPGDSKRILWGTGGAGSDSALRGLLPHYNAGGAVYQYQVQYVKPDGTSQQAVYNTADLPSNDGQWRHWLFQKDVDQDLMRIFLDGQQVAIRQGSHPSRSIKHLIFGGDGTFSGAFVGYVKDLRIYDYFLDDDEIAMVNAGEHPVEPQPKGKLLGWWKLDEGSGDTAYDYSGYNWTGTIVGDGPHVWDAQGGLYVDQNVNTQYVDIPVNIATNAIALSFWAKGNVGPVNDAHVLWGKGGPTGTDDVLKGYFPFYNAGQDIYQYQVQYVGSDGNEQAVYSSTLQESRDGQWHHWLFQKDANRGIIEVYLDGEVMNKRVGQIKPIWPISHLSFGGRGSDTTAYKGYLKDLRIYDFLLNDVDIDMVLAGDHPVEPTGPEPEGYLLGWWKFDEVSGNTVYDHSGNDWTATVVGSGPYTWDTEGGIYIDQHATANYVNITDIDISDNGEAINAITIAFWAKGDVGPDNNVTMLWAYGGPTGSEIPLKGYFPFYNAGQDIYQYQLQNFGPDGAMETGPYNSSLQESRDGQWHHWVFQKDAQFGLTRVYVDGVLKGSRAETYRRIWPITDLRFGGNGSQASAYNGYLKDLRIYNYFLDESAIGEVMAGGNPAAPLPEPEEPDYECGRDGFFLEDLNADCYVTIDDLQILIDNWLSVE